MKHFFHPEALEEYLNAVSYYANISSELAKSFVRAIESAIDNILTHPEGWQIVEKGVRRYLVKRFPFGIYYCIEGNSILIYAIMHMSRHPNYWQSRIP